MCFHGCWEKEEEHAKRRRAMRVCWCIFLRFCGGSGGDLAGGNAAEGGMLHRMVIIRKQDQGQRGGRRKGRKCKKRVFESASGGAGLLRRFTKPCSCSSGELFSGFRNDAQWCTRAQSRAVERKSTGQWGEARQEDKFLTMGKHRLKEL